MILTYVHPQVAALLGAVVAVRALVGRLLAAALERLVTLEGALPAVAFAAVLAAERVRLGEAHVLGVVLPATHPVRIQVGERCEQKTEIRDQK